jgi:PPOX class probable F420-dependent enzyme
LPSILHHGVSTFNYNMNMPIPAAIHGQRYMSLATFRKTGVAVYTPVWFAEEGDKLYVMTNSKLGKVKRIRNNPNVKVAPCGMRGKITGPESSATARLIRAEQGERARRAIRAKYWVARLPFIWRNSDTYIEISLAA